MIRDQNGPTIVTNKLDKAEKAGPNITDFSPPGQSENTGKIITWGGGATEGDMPGWSLGFQTGGGLGVIFDAIPPLTPGVFAAIGSVVGFLTGGIFELIFDDEIIWFFEWKIKAYCEKNQYGVWVLNVSSTRKEEYEDNDWDDYYTEYSETSSFVMPN